MRVGDLCSAPAIVTTPVQPLAAAARQLRDQGIGALVVIDAAAPSPKPLGILTDRDIVCGQLDRAADLHCLAVGDVMTRDPLTVRADLEVTEAIRALSVRGVRRAPVVDSSGTLIGVVTLDDLLPEVAQQLNALAGVASAQIHQARRAR